MISIKFVLLATLATTYCTPVPESYLQPETYLHPDAGLNVLELIVKHGYPLERHTLVTEDGYILEMQRIPHGRHNENEKNKPPVLFMHGLGSSSADWVNTGPDHSLAYMLADLGYDVWLGNARGNAWGRNHTTLDPDKDSKKFWNFSWHEIATIDVALFIDHVLEVNGAEKLHYIGYSQGGTVFFVLMSEKPEYNDKIVLMNAFGPAVFMSNAEDKLFKLFGKYEHSIAFLKYIVGIYEFVPKSPLYEILGKTLCEETSPVVEVCAAITFLMYGYDSEQLNRTIIPVILTNTPSGSSTKQYLHYGQSVKNRHFQRYDYHWRNMEIYGQKTPPHYDLSKVTAPVALHYGQNDIVVAVEDVLRLRDLLPNVVMDNKIKYEKFNHLDFAFAMDIYELLYKDVIELILKY